MKKTDLAYFAGIFDGEGSVTISIRKPAPQRHQRSPCHYLRVCVGNTNEWLIRQHEFAFGGHISKREDPGKDGKCKTAWMWTVTSTQAAQFLQAILPYLHIKRPQAEIGLSLQRDRKVRRARAIPVSSEELAVREAQRLLLKKMNKKGPSESNHA